jgi:acetyltransferase-like isoleucine patch superfamily enzyme
MNPSLIKIAKNIIFFQWCTFISNCILLLIKNVQIANVFKIKISGHIKIINKGNIIIGSSVIINSGKSYNCIGGDIRTIFNVQKKGTLTIGSNVGISNSTLVCQNSIIIEDDVLIGGGCKIYDTDFHSLDYFQRSKWFVENKIDEQSKQSPIKIKKGAWIGGHCIILKGVVIGEKAIIGAGSVVTKSVPNNEIWAGNPAKFVKRLLDNPV